jgi:hypothetical protein
MPVDEVGPRSTPNLGRGVGRTVVVLFLMVGPIWAWCLGGCDRQSASPPATPRGAQKASTRPTAEPTNTPPRPAEAAPLTAATQPVATTRAAATQPAIPTDGVVAYYFHRTLRCMTCLAIEKGAKEAIEAAFQGAIDSGRLAWLPVDYQAPANWHFAMDYALETSTLVLVEMRGGKPVRWKALPKTWELIENPGRFQEYVWAEVEEYLGG